MEESAGSALDLARLQSELRDSVDQQQASADVLRIISRAPSDPQAVFDEIVRRGLVLCEADSATLSLFDKGHASVVANAGEFRDVAGYLAAFGKLPLDLDPQTIVGRILIEKATVRIPNMKEAGLRRAPGPATGARCVVAAPLLREDGVLGMLVVRRRTEVPFNDRHVHLLEVFADQAVIAIATARLFQTVKRQTEELSRFVSPQVARLISSEEGIQLLDGHRRDITAVHCELRGFVSVSQETDPEEVLDILREFHAGIGDLCLSHGATLDRVSGDAILAFLNDPVPVERHERAAVSLALAMRDRGRQLTSEWKRKGFDLGVAIGVGTGYATLGRTGFEGRYEYAAVGNVVLVAARLAAHAQVGEILVSERVHAAIEGDLDATAVGALAIGDMRRPINAFQVAGVRG